jgi:cytidine deaminase
MKQKYSELLKQAHKAKENAYSPYSGFKVGAAILAKDGQIIDGCNVENAAYGSTMCAERTAIFKAVSMGYKPGDFQAIAIASSGDNFSPCGSCRQVINEFGEDIDLIFEWNGDVVVETLKQVLPFNFILEEVK